MRKLQKYFLEPIDNVEEIHGHFNQNFKVTTIDNNVYHLKLFRDQTHLVKKWIEGSTVKRWDEATIVQVIQAMQQLHLQSHPQWPKMNFNKCPISDQRYHQLVNKYANHEFVPCHNDLNKDNIIMTNTGAALIDFEFKRLNNKHWDVANIINEDRLDQRAINLFLKHYPSLNRATLQDFIYINKVFNETWKQQYE